jgi:hypothetical protein
MDAAARWGWSTFDDLVFTRPTEATLLHPSMPAVAGRPS